MSLGLSHNGLGRFPPAPAEVRFMRHVEVREDGCWRWTGSRCPGGYGMFTPATRRSIRAHSWAYQRFIGEVPVGMQLDHLCHSADPSCPGGRCEHRACVNPAHLEPVSPRENVRRGRGNGKQTHCPQGHAYAGPNLLRDPLGRRKCRSCMNTNRVRLGLMRQEQHGTTTGYTYGCRCDRCRGARAAYERQRRTRAVA